MSPMEDSTTNGGGDDLDRAAELTQLFTDSALAAAMKKSLPQQMPGSDGEYPYPDCVDCGEPIIMARLQMGRIRCVECQTRLERGMLH